MTPYFPYSPQVLLSRPDRWRAAARALGLSKDARHRLEWFIWHNTHGENVSLTARHFGLARKTLHQWLGRFDETNLRLLEERSRRPHRLRSPQFVAEEVARVQILRGRYPSAGRAKLEILYQDDYDCTIRPWALRRICRDYHLEAERAVRTKRQSVQRRIVAKKRVTELVRQPVPGFLVEADTIVRYWNGQKRYIVTATDLHTRLSFARMYSTKAARNAADFLRRLVILLDGDLKNLHIDNGSEFQGAFQLAAQQLGVQLYHARPYQPKDKPVIERFNGVLQQEFVDLGHFTLDVDDFNRDLTDYLIYYNFKRPHHSLGLRRPMEVAMLSPVPTRQVLPMYPPRTN